MLSVVITAWNEELNLPRAIASVKSIADEIVVVDTESTDKTAEVAKKLGCKVYKHANTGIVEPVRNFSTSKARGDWILLLDADEEVSPKLAEYIAEIVANPEADYYRIARRSIIFGQWIKSEHWWPDYVYRLFKKGSITWSDTIHSIPETIGTGQDLPAREDLSIIHYHYNSIHQYLSRMDRYTDFQVKAKIANDYIFNWPDLVIKPIDEFFNQYFARKGFSQGLHGLALSVLQMISEAVLYLKLWEANRFIETEPKIDDLVKSLREKAKEFTWWTYQAKIETSIWPVKYFWKLKRKLNG